MEGGPSEQQTGSVVLGQTPEDQFWFLFKSIDLSKTLGVTDATQFARRPTYNFHLL